LGTIWTEWRYLKFIKYALITALALSSYSAYSQTTKVFVESTGGSANIASNNTLVSKRYSSPMLRAAIGYDLNILRIGVSTALSAISFYKELSIFEIMKYLHIIIIVVFAALSSCGSRVQVYSFTSNSDKVHDSSFTYCNDTIEIKYNFSSEYGVFGFQVRNLGNDPIYIDWSKSAFIYNNVKNDYWRDSWKSVSTTSALNPWYIGTIQLGYKEERVTFIPPKALYKREQFQILTGFNLKNQRYDVSTSVVSRNDKLTKKTKVQTAFFSESNCPIILRNFLTYSIEEDFKSVNIIDHEFRLKMVQEMDSRHFEYFLLDPSKAGNWYLRDQEGNPIRSSKYRTPNSFFVHVNRAGSIR
jgi:hypothetical protein